MKERDAIYADPEADEKAFMRAADGSTGFAEARLSEMASIREC